MDRRRILTFMTLVFVILFLAAVPGIGLRLRGPALSQKIQNLAASPGMEHSPVAALPKSDSPPAAPGMDHSQKAPREMGQNAASSGQGARVTPADREAAARRAQFNRFINPNWSTNPLGGTAGLSDLVGAAAALDPLGDPDYFGTIPNYANSPLPDVDGSGNVTPGTGMRKFVDSLPGLGAANANNLGQFMPVAVPDTTTYPGSDYYEIGLVEYTEQLHSDLPPTKLRGYVQLYPTTTTPHYLGPAIVAERDRPVRVKFTNMLPTGSDGDLFLPVDKTVMGAGNGPDGTPYSENRATVHLHGGATPWISDGTPHQWTTPAGEATNYPEGVSVSNVPDMPDPGPGSLTFFYTNQQSARLMFYHDHSYGITRLNVYGGEAAPYILNDPVEKELVDGNTAIAPRHRKIARGVAAGTIPAEQVPLVIQDKSFVPDDDQLAATDPTWYKAKWGGLGSLWFPHVYMTNQNPNDLFGVNAMGRWDYGPWFWPITPVVNGPTPEGDPSTPNPSEAPESFLDTPVVNGTAYPFLKVGRKAYRFRILNAANERFLNLQLYYAKSNTPDSVDTTTGLPTLQTDSGDIAMVPANPHPDDPEWPENWPTDGRDGGVPDPAVAGPKMIQIGNEGGFLPAPVVLDNQPVGFEYNRRDFTALNIIYKTLLLGPAERADVIVDFSDVPAGSKLILYNDAPAPVPAFDPRYDYYTGNPDYTSSGGAPTTQPGYGPNTRTIMQIQVDGAASPAFDVPALEAALPAAFEAAQDPIIVPETAYGDAADTYVGIQDQSVSFTPDGTTTPVTLPVARKSMQDEMFEQEYGRMMANFGVERPFVNILERGTLPFKFIDPTTEMFTDSVVAAPVSSGDGTQIWKFTNNGVDTHVAHFHYFNVQLINKVGWDGAIRPADPNELGWKESVRMNPLEDTIVALRPVAPTLPFKIGDSVRPLDPTMPLGTTDQFSLFDWLGNPAAPVNEMTNFGWEFVLHCHMLSHEENDMMRPMFFQVSPSAPTTLKATPSTLSASPPSVKLKWTNNATTPEATMFTIERSTDTSFTANLATFTSSAASAQYIDGSVDPAKTYYYRVRAENTSAYSVWSNTITVNTAGQLPLAPTDLSVVGSTTTSTISIGWTNRTGGAPPNNIRIQSSTNGGSTWTTAATLSPTATAHTLTGLTSDTPYRIRVSAVNNYGASPSGAVEEVTQP